MVRVLAGAQARRFARGSAVGALVPGMAGQVIYHLLAAAHATRAPWPVVMLVSCMPLVTRTAEASGFGERRPQGRAVMAERPASLERPVVVCQRPPETVISLPVTNDAAREISHDTVAATSSGRPMRPSGLRATASSACGTAVVASVAMTPGETLLTRDSFGSDLVGQAAGEHHQGAFGGRIGHESWQAAGPGGDRGDVDDGAARTAVRGRHRSHGVPGAQHRARDVDCHQPGQLVRVPLVDARLLAGCPGVVNRRGQQSVSCRARSNMSATSPGAATSARTAAARPPRARMAETTDSARSASAA